MNLQPEEVAILTAAHQFGGERGEAYEFGTEQCGKILSIGSIHFPPQINNPEFGNLATSLAAEQQWGRPVRSLLARGLVGFEPTNIYFLAGAGRRVIEKFQAAPKFWKRLTDCLRELQAAQEAQLTAPNTATHAEVFRLASQLLEVCAESRAL